MSDQISILRQMFNTLSKEEQADFLNSLNRETTKVQTFETFKEAIIKRSNHPLQDRCNCPHCQSNNVVKNGHKDNIQRFKCKECRKTFTFSNNTILFSTKKDLYTWKKYCECFLNKLPLRRCAAICDISLETAFRWRHKILDALQNMQSEVTLKGIVESDETFFALSFKGTKEENFSIPREVHKRGHSVSTRGLSSEMVCVPCIVNHEGLSVGQISNLGKPKVQHLEKVINNKIEQGSVFVTDSLKGYQKVAVNNELVHIRIPRGKHKSGNFNIQTVNSYHSELKRMINSIFKGVATKYLNNYIVYNNFVNFAKNTFENKINKLENFVFTTKCLSKASEIKFRPAIPV